MRKGRSSRKEKTVLASNFLVAWKCCSSHVSQMKQSADTTTPLSCFVKCDVEHVSRNEECMTKKATMLVPSAIKVTVAVMLKRKPKCCIEWTPEYREWWTGARCASTTLASCDNVKIEEFESWCHRREGDCRKRHRVNVFRRFPHLAWVLCRCLGREGDCPGGRREAVPHRLSFRVRELFHCHSAEWEMAWVVKGKTVLYWRAPFSLRESFVPVKFRQMATSYCAFGLPHRHFTWPF